MNENVVKGHRVIQKFLRKERWYVKISPALNGDTVLPYANFIWLMNNPGFVQIPKGYVIHHLDHDELNDDISNLALMQKHHHDAHHWKQKIVTPEIILDPEIKGRVRRTIYFPAREPKIYQHARGFKIYFPEKIDGKTESVFIYSWNGHTIKTKENAEFVKNQIWHPIN